MWLLLGLQFYLSRTASYQFNLVCFCNEHLLVVFVDTRNFFSETRFLRNHIRGLIKVSLINLADI